MAYKDSGELPIGQSYQLGDYVFSITVSHDPGESETGINVRCDKGDERARVASEVSGTVESWRVEANEDTADVYVTYKQSYLNTVAYMTFQYRGGGGSTFYQHMHPAGIIEISGTDVTFINNTDQQAIVYRTYSKNSTSPAWGTPIQIAPGTQYTVDIPESSFNIAGPFYETDGGEPYVPDKDITILVARFAIDLHDAGGTGTDSDWHDPGDWDEERDPEDPPTTLRLTITGASAGAHSGVPSSPAPQQTYGSGGNGGNGGGGGAGASTVIVYKFATDRADSKEITATARGAGAGSSGGPGGKGGDGCILIFY